MAIFDNTKMCESPQYMHALNKLKILFLGCSQNSSEKPGSHLLKDLQIG